MLCTSTSNIVYHVIHLFSSFLLFPFPPLPFTQLSALYSQMMAKARPFNVTVPHGQNINLDLFTISEGVIVCMIIPVLNHLILPFNPGLNMKMRMGLGVFFLVLSVGVMMLLIIPGKVENQLFLWLLLPTSLFSIADVLIVITGEYVMWNLLYL